MEINKEQILQRVTTPTTTAPHELADIVNRIEKEIGFTGRYTYGYWLKRCKGLSLDKAISLIATAKTKREPGPYLSAMLKPKQ